MKMYERDVLCMRDAENDCEMCVCVKRDLHKRPTNKMNECEIRCVYV